MEFVEEEVQPIGYFKILVVDDDETVHEVMSLALGNVCIAKRRIKILSAYAAYAGFQLLEQHADIALLITDIDLKSDDSGFQLIRRVRSDGRFVDLPILIRTGQVDCSFYESFMLKYNVSGLLMKSKTTCALLISSISSALGVGNENPSKFI